MIDFNDANDACGCSQGGEEAFNCAHKPYPFSDEELAIFDQLRMIKEESRQLKSRLEEIENESNGRILTPLQLEEKLFCSDRLEALRLLWNRLKEESEEAATRRMIHLGHIDPKP
jgi:hypothetical protein